MKIRNGFVSNSSSSSFVVCEMVELTNEVKDHNYKLLDEYYGFGNDDEADEIINQYKGKVIYVGCLSYDQDIEEIEDMVNALVNTYAPGTKIECILGVN